MTRETRERHLTSVTANGHFPVSNYYVLPQLPWYSGRRLPATEPRIQHTDRQLDRRLTLTFLLSRPNRLLLPIPHRRPLPPFPAIACFRQSPPSLAIVLPSQLLLQSRSRLYCSLAASQHRIVRRTQAVASESFAEINLSGIPSCHYLRHGRIICTASLPCY